MNTTFHRTLPSNTKLQDRYRVIQALGSGGMGMVYEAVDERLQITVALKETRSNDERSRRQFVREAQLLAQLHHPSLPRVSDHFVEDGRAFLVMQYISGPDLARILAQQSHPFPTNQVIAWADQLLDALIYLHSCDRQIIHRDIKPHNLKVSENGRIALLDFGLAKRHVEEKTESGVCGYTPCYAPLEQIQDNKTTPQSDLYALGATLYHLFTGVKPTDALARAAALINDDPDPLRPANQIILALGDELTTLLKHAMALNPAERYRSATEFRDALRQLGRNSPIDSQRALSLPSQAREVEDEGTVLAEPSHLIPSISPPVTASRTRIRPAAACAALLLILIGGTVLGIRFASGGESPNFGTHNPLFGRGFMESDASGYKKPKQQRSDKPASVASAELQHSRGELRPSGARRPTDIQTVMRLRPRKLSRDQELQSTKNIQPVFRASAPDEVSRGAGGLIDSVKSKREVLRSSQGIQVVKFADGSTRAFRPGERISEDGEQ